MLLCFQFNFLFTQNKKDLAIDVLEVKKEINILLVKHNDPKIWFSDSLEYVNSINKILSQVPDKWEDRSVSFNIIKNLTFKEAVAQNKLKANDLFIEWYQIFRAEKTYRGSVPEFTGNYFCIYGLNMFAVKNKGTKMIVKSLRQTGVLRDKRLVSTSNYEFKIVVNKLEEKLLTKAYLNKKKKRKRQINESNEKVEELNKLDDSEKRKEFEKNLGRKLTDEEFETIKKGLENLPKNK